MPTQVKRIYKKVIDTKSAKVLSYIKVHKLYEELKDRLNLTIVNGEYSFERPPRENT